MPSLEHIKYLKSEKHFKILVFLTQIIIIFSFIILWQFLTDKKIIDSFIFSSPIKIYKTIINLIKNNNLFYHIWITSYETIISFILGSFIGIVIASIMWWNKFIRKVLEPFLIVLNSLPKVALGPIIIIWFGANTNSIIIMALLISVIVMTMSLLESFLNTDKNKITLMKVLGSSKFQIFFKLVMPSSKKVIISTLKICISMSLIGVIMGEFLVSKAGIGYLIMYGSQVFNLDLVISGILILAIISWIMYALISCIEKRLIN